MIAAQPYALAIVGLVCFALGGLIGLAVGGAAAGSSEADDFLEARHEGYGAGYRAAKDDAGEHECFTEDTP